MKFKRIISILCFATISVTSIPIDVFASEIKRSFEQNSNMEAFLPAKSDNFIGYNNEFEIGKSQIKDYVNNGGSYGSSMLSKAFDGNINTHWETGTPNSNTFNNEIIVTFNDTVTFNKVVYGARKDSYNKGFATRYKIYASQTENEDDFELITKGNSSASTAGLFEIKFNNTIFKRIKFIFTEAKGAWASSSELKFYKEDIVSDEIARLFIDGETVSEEFNTLEKLDSLEDRIKTHPLKVDFQVKINEARVILINNEMIIPNAQVKIFGHDKSDGFQTYNDNFAATINSYNNNGGHWASQVLGNAFDRNVDTYWETSKGNTGTFKNEVTVEFEENMDINRMIYAPRNDTKGFATKFEILTSQTTVGNDFVYVATGEYAPATSQFIEIKFPKTSSKRVRFRFLESTQSWATAKEFIFYKEDKLLDEVENMFTSNNKTELKPEYQNIEKLKELEAMINEHALKDTLIVELERAKLILDGIINEDNNPENDFPYEVSTIQKTGPDAESLVFLFMGDGYTKEQQDKFINDANTRFNELMLWEPYKSFANNINAYAIKTISNEEGIGRFASPGVSVIKKDTFYGIQSNYLGTARLIFYGNGDKANPIINEFTNKFLEKGATTTSRDILSNTNFYGGSGGSLAMSTLSAGVKMVIHEGAHSYAGLTDEYSLGSEETPNRTNVTEPSKVKWKEFLGYRQVGIVPYGKGHNPSSMCIMQSLYTDSFCEVCKLRIFDRFNSNINYKHSEYATDGLITIETEPTKDQYTNPKVKTEIRNDNIIKAQNEKLSFRSIVRNYTEEEKKIKINLTITDSEGINIKHEVSKEFILGSRKEISSIYEYGDDLKSLEVKTGILTDIEESDLIIGTLTDITDPLNHKVIKTDKDHYAPIGVVKTDAYLGSNIELTEEKLPTVTQISSVPLETGSEYLVKPPKIKDYTYVSSSIPDNKLTVASGDNAVKLYYAKSRVPMTLQLVSPSGQVVSEVKKYLNYKEQYTPTIFDFEGINTTINENIDPSKITIPTDKPIADGINDVILQYHYAEDVKNLSVIAVDENNIEIGRKSLGAKLPGETVQVSALTKIDIAELDIYKLKDEEVKTITLEDSIEIIFKYERMKKSFRVVAKDQSTGKELVEISNEIKNTNTNVLVKNPKEEEFPELDQYRYIGHAEYLVNISNNENLQEHVLPYERIKKDVSVIAIDDETSEEIGRVELRNQVIGDTITLVAPTSEDIVGLDKYKLNSPKEYELLVSSDDVNQEVKFLYTKVIVTGEATYKSVKGDGITPIESEIKVNGSIGAWEDIDGGGENDLLPENPEVNPPSNLANINVTVPVSMAFQVATNADPVEFVTADYKITNNNSLNDVEVYLSEFKAKMGNEFKIVEPDTILKAKDGSVDMKLNFIYDKYSETPTVIHLKDDFTTEALLGRIVKKDATSVTTKNNVKVMTFNSTEFETGEDEGRADSGLKAGHAIKLKFALPTP